MATPSYSSWGERGYAERWLGEKNDWIYPHLHAAGARMIHLADRMRGTDDVWVRRGLNQMARELLLAQSSDWAFIIKTGTMAEYAAARTRGHLGAVEKLYRQIRDAEIDAAALESLESRNNIFPSLQFEIFAD
ncbi:DUF1957 domain-containing protein [Candidatus Sumerlaeota bacterium]|nr:DUF1957 domain-containing protein [Candidatus Sumerlaeota bacterium]